VTLNKAYNWDIICSKAKAVQLEVTPDWRRYDNDNSGHNGIRMGFASLNEEEIHEAINRLVTVFEKL
ncbi:hypothetical protein J9332_41060, partial [Aquimarina celericrescens]|nr:hypothetical protein [Aquimarina celericrescens]